jgi:hypothetical protein
MKSVREMIIDLDAARDVQNVSEWEDGFIGNMVNHLARNNQSTEKLSDKQVEVIDRLWRKYVE